MNLIDEKTTAILSIKPRLGGEFNKLDKAIEGAIIFKELLGKFDTQLTPILNFNETLIPITDPSHMRHTYWPGLLEVPEEEPHTEIDGQLELTTTPEQATPPRIIDREYGNMTITGALVTSPQFKAWVDYNRQVEMLFDIDETLGTGWMSPEHFQAFLRFAGDKRKCNKKTCKNHEL